MLNKKISLLILIILILSISSVSFADDTLGIRSWTVFSTLNENGDLIVSEDITFDFRDKFNGVYRNIVLTNTDGIENLKLSQLEDNDEIFYTLVDSAKKGDKNVFTAAKKKDTLELMIFSPSNNEEKTFRINYTVKNVAIRHKDIGELYYKFIGKENATPIEYFSAKITLPKIDREKTKIFAHGPLHGTIDFLEDNLIELEVFNVPAETFVEGRILFPPDFIGASENIGNSSFENIMDEELALIRSIEKKAESRAKNKTLFGNISLIFTALEVAIIGFVFNKFRRNIDSNSSYFSLNDITPAELRLFFQNIIDSRSLMTTIFDLARKGFLTVEEIETSQKSSKKKKKDFLFRKTKNSDFDLTSHEKYIFNWLFNHIGNGQKVSTKDIEDYRKSSYTKFNKELLAWQNEVRADVKSQGYYDDRGHKWGWFVLFLGVVSLILGLLSLTFDSLYGIIPLLLSVPIFFYSIVLLFRKSDKGYIQYLIWKDIKRDLSKNRDILKDYDTNISTDRILIYALALGLPMKTIDNFRDNFQESYNPSHWAYLYFLTNKYGGSMFEDRFNSSFYPGSSTTNSSSIGSGGGFSGGGGGGAGGGGAGGF
ncbi:DUF2207 domain-containing protein [Tissierella pigra]|uniref:DUF2207 domain-containing protein n=1 Tax=Tissierella pigra TaxID=2607614 RepID=UPI0018A6C668|nr:DUF2207 domain-containing protein [Tissierella pigra]